MTVSLIIPFASDDERRLKIFDWVETRWEDTCPGFEICVGHDDPKDFNRSKARNRAFEESHGDIIVISDADTACPVDSTLMALTALQESGTWVIAHTDYYSLTEGYTDWLLEQPPFGVLRPPFESNWVMKCRSQAGVLVMTRKMFEQAGGYDERFLGWGWEDSEFAVRLIRTVGDPVRIQGPMLHLWHDPGLNFKQPFIDHNQALYERTVRGD